MSDGENSLTMPLPDVSINLPFSDVEEEDVTEVSEAECVAGQFAFAFKVPKEHSIFWIDSRRFRKVLWGTRPDELCPCESGLKAGECHLPILEDKGYELEEESAELRWSSSELVASYERLVRNQKRIRDDVSRVLKLLGTHTRGIEEERLALRGSVEKVLEGVDACISSLNEVPL